MTSEPVRTDVVLAETVAGLARTAAERYGDKTALRFKRDGEWQELSFNEVSKTVNEIALGLIDLGVAPGDRVAILADTSPEWTLASFAVWAAGGVVVPIYPTNSPEECEWVAGNSGARAVICDSPEQLAKIEQVRGALPELQYTIGTREGAGEMTIDDLRERGRRSGDVEELRRREAAVTPDDAFIFIYTSGTTGPPKGVVLTHRNGAMIGVIVQELDFVREGDVSYLYLPLAHVFALTVQIGSFEAGTVIVYFGGDTRQIIPELTETNPTYLPSVPRIFEKLYAMATAQAEKGSPEQRQQFYEAIELGVKVRELQRQGQQLPPQLQEPFDEADKRIFAPVRGLFGGRIRQAVSGAAPIAPEILRFFYACGVPVLEGWGMTETTAVGTVNTLDHIKFGTVGRPVPHCEVRIAEEDGEILLRGPNIFREYWKNPEATAETLVDGWLHTGDVGELDDEGYLKITGRKKDIIITAGGKNLAPANLENDLKQSRWISQAVMHGDRRPFPVALVTLDEEEIMPWARERGLPEDLGALATNEDVRALIQADLDRANAKYAQVEQIKKFTILDRDLSQETGELTPTLKVKRNVINDKFAELFEGMYSR
jgi:long-chain acyl-CoA synthetase